MPEGKNLGEDLKGQLATVRGHIEGVSRMVDQGRGCADVLHQVSAIQGALASVRRELIEYHITQCVIGQVAAGDIEKVIEGIVDVVIGGSRRAHSPVRRSVASRPDDETEYRYAEVD